MDPITRYVSTEREAERVIDEMKKKKLRLLYKAPIKFGGVTQTIKLQFK